MNNVLSIVVPVYNIAPIYLIKCIESVRNQTDPNWELVLCDDCSTSQETLNCLESYRGTDSRIRVIRKSINQGIALTTNRAIEFTTGDFIGFLDNDDELASNAIAEVHHYISYHPETDLLYTDEDKLDENGKHCDTYYKPNWSPEHLQSCMYILHFTVIRKSLLCELGLLRPEFDGAQDYDLVLRASKKARHVGHIAKILYHWRKIPGSAAEIVDAKPTALNNAARSLKDVTGHVVVQGMLPGLLRVRPSLDPYPFVTILIPTNDGSLNILGRGEFNLLVNLLQSIKEKTTYPNYKVLIVDNHNLSEQTRASLASLDIDIRIESYTQPPGSFSFAHKFNFCWPLVETEHLILLNDDIEVISPDWIEALLEPMQDSGVGVVGARLLHADRTIQHVGVVLGVHNGAAHIYHGFPADYIGYNGYTHVIRNYSAVTGACMLTRRSLLEKLYGFDERYRIDYNDIDYCLRVQELGFRIVYTPFAELYHFESSTVVRQNADNNETLLFNDRWATTLLHDPYYNENLPRNRHDYFHVI
jgi:GT2 family glycosyltransferase